MVIAYVIFFLAGLGFGYAAPPKAKWLPLLFPLALALGTLFREGLEGAVVMRLVVALAITLAGILLGAMMDRAGQRREAGAGA